MEESKASPTKRLLGSSLPWISNSEEAEVEADYLNPIPKRPCTSRDGDSFEEFFALLQRIEETHRYCSRTRSHLNRLESAVKCVKTVASKASWRPAFEWEDFSSRGNGTRDVESTKAGDGRVEEKEVVRHANENLKSEAKPNPCLEGLDLNSLPEGLQLFQ